MKSQRRLSVESGPARVISRTGESWPAEQERACARCAVRRTCVGVVLAFLGPAIPIVRERDGKAARCGRRQRRTQPPSAKATNYSHVAFEMKANLYKAPVNLSHLSFSGFFDGKYHLNVNVTENWVCAKALTGAFMELLK